MINSFKGEYAYLSNFYACKFEYKGIQFNCSEQAFMWEKSENPEYRAKLLSLTNPVEIKRLGRTCKLVPNWDSIKVQVMEDIVKAKFTQNPKLQTCLSMTGDQELIEGNTWNDTFWGVCNGKGENYLGRILMKVREELYMIF